MSRQPLRVVGLAALLVILAGCFGDGTFQVGRLDGNVTPGVYESDGGSGCSWAVHGPGGEVLSSGSAPAGGPARMTIPWWAASVTSNGCGTFQLLTPELPSGSDAIIERVIDGDTFELAGGERVRVLNIDTPEVPDGCLADAAAQRTAALLPPGTLVRLTTESGLRDQYGRLLAHVTRASDGVELGPTLVAEGLAQTLFIEPNTSRSAYFAWLQDIARGEGRGIWGADCSDPQPPPPPPVGGNCHPAYPSVCIPPPPPDLDCGDIPHRRFAVVPPDPHRFDGDRDGIGCER